MIADLDPEALTLLRRIGVATAISGGMLIERCNARDRLKRRKLIENAGRVENVGTWGAARSRWRLTIDGLALLQRDGTYTEILDKVA